jgi:predicted enzyme related to lactoylglutathione lyase
MSINPLCWFEIPAININRAVGFYNNVFGWNMEVMDFGGELNAWTPFNHEAPGAAGCIVQHPEHYTPSSNAGVLIYFSVDDIAATLEAVEKNGGSILQHKKLITEDVGYMGVFLDTEGNRIAVHSRRG